MKYKELRSIFLVIEKVNSVGGSITDSLDIINNGIQLSKKTKKDMLKVAQQVKSGIKLSDALKNIKAVDHVSYEILRAAEFSGNFSDTLKMLVEYLETRRKNTIRITVAIAKASSSLLFCLGLFNLAVKIIIPKFEDMFDIKIIQDTLINRVLMFIGRNIFSIIACLILLYIIEVLFEKSNKIIGEKISILKLKIPFFGKVLVANESFKYISVLDLMIASRIDLQMAILMSSNVLSNLAYKNSIERVYENMISGSSFSKAITKEKIIPYDVSSMISIGEKTGNFGGLLGILKVYYAEKLELYLKSLEGTMKGISMISMSVLFLWLFKNTTAKMYQSMTGIAGGGDGGGGDDM